MSILDITPSTKTVIDYNYLYNNGWYFLEPNFLTIWELKKNIIVPIRNISNASLSTFATEELRSNLKFQFNLKTKTLNIEHHFFRPNYSRFPAIDREAWKQQTAVYQKKLEDILYDFVYLNVENVEQFEPLLYALETDIKEFDIDINKVEEKQKEWNKKHQKR
jgi:hypothetical protein